MRDLVAAETDPSIISFFMAHALLRPVGGPSANISPRLLDCPFQDVGGRDLNGPILLVCNRPDALIDFEGCKKHDRVVTAELAHPHAT